MLHRCVVYVRRQKQKSLNNSLHPCRYVLAGSDRATAVEFAASGAPQPGRMYPNPGVNGRANRIAVNQVLYPS